MLLRVMKSVEGVKKLLLSSRLICQDLNVVHDKYVDMAVAIAKGVGVALPKGGDEVVNELLTGKVENSRGRFRQGQFVGDGLDKVGLSEPDGPIKEERVEGGGRPIGHPLGSGMGEPIAGPDDEVLKGVVGVEEEGLLSLVPERRFRGGSAGPSAGEVAAAGGEVITTGRISISIRLAGRASQIRDP